MPRLANSAVSCPIILAMQADIDILGDEQGRVPTNASTEYLNNKTRKATSTEDTKGRDPTSTSRDQSMILHPHPFKDIYSHQSSLHRDQAPNPKLCTR